MKQFIPNYGKYYEVIMHGEKVWNGSYDVLVKEPDKKYIISSFIIHVITKLNLLNASKN